jgi:integrase
MHPVYVFVRRSEDGLTVPVKKMNNTGWMSARERAADAWERTHGTVAPEGFRRVRVHDLKHTFGRRLRAAGVSFEDRQDLLGHKSQRITTHFTRTPSFQISLRQRRKHAAEKVTQNSPTSWPRGSGDL